MALGDAGKMKNTNLLPVNAYGYSFINTDSKALIKSKLSFSMWSNFLKISIYEDMQYDENGIITWNDKNGSSIFLNFSKANRLLHLLSVYRENKRMDMEYNVVEGGKSFIAVYNGTYFGKDVDTTVVRIVQFADHEKTKLMRQSAYQINNSAPYGKYNDETMKISYDDKHSYIDNELDLLIIQLKTFVKAMSNSYAYANMANTVYNDSMTRLFLKEILHKLGCAIPSNLNGQIIRTSNNKFIANQKQNDVIDIDIPNFSDLPDAAK